MKKKLTTLLICLLIIGVIAAVILHNQQNNEQNVGQMQENTSTAAEQQTTLPAEEQTTITEEVKTTIAEEETLTADEADSLAAAEEQRMLNIINQFTVDYDEAEREFFEADAFLYVLMPHVEHEEILKRWEDSVSFQELTLEYEDKAYGTATLRFKGVPLHEMFISIINGIAIDYDSCRLYDRPGDMISLTREEIIEQEIYLMAYCEDRLFGYPKDGGSGPFWLVSTKDGKLEFLSDQIVTVNISLPRGARF